MKLSFCLLIIAALFVASIADAKPKARKPKGPKPNVHRPKAPKLKVSNGISTWYDGKGLEGAACYGRLKGRKVDARDNWPVAAVNFRHFGGEKNACFKCARVSKGNKSVNVRIIDGCRSCKPGHIDLTKGSFRKLANLDDGIPEY
ncbi:hypothetical protein DFQ26_006823 [Actinomortierella ambigua]|nr:hypothetical protein DFQ26_006823 [Actinomortierella ambigua]